MNTKPKKMSRQDFLRLFPAEVQVVPGDPRSRIKKTKKGALHEVNPSSRPSVGLVTPAEYVRRSKKRNQALKQARLQNIKEQKKIRKEGSNG